jgi:hypothetical protein
MARPCGNELLLIAQADERTNANEQRQQESALVVRRLRAAVVAFVHLFSRGHLARSSSVVEHQPSSVF